MFGLGIWELIIVLVIIGLPILIIKLLNIHRNKPYKMEEVPIYDHTSLWKLYFSFNGRIPRSTFWLKYQLPMLVITIIAFIIANPTSKDDIYAVVGFVTLLTIYPSIVVNVKRAHDRYRPWWFIILYLIPFIDIWIAIELLFLKGTTGINRHGRDPLEQSTGNTKDNFKKTNSDKETTSEKTPESPEERMQQLADMKEKGLISEEDYNSKKEEILKKL